jgi:hypothetical protein
MIRKGIKYRVIATEMPGIWRWRFCLGNELKTGKTETRIAQLAIRRVELRIDRELRKVATHAT